MNFLSESRIDYLTHRWNIHTGCNNGETGLCQVSNLCWARREVDENPQRYPFGFEPHFWPEAIDAALSLKGPCRVGVAFQGDICSTLSLPNLTFNFPFRVKDGRSITVRTSVRDAVFSVCRVMKNCSFLFLTKNWAALPGWEPFPDNVWVGATATNQKAFDSAVLSLPYIRCHHRWLSIEPPFEQILSTTEKLFFIEWIVIGAQTRPLKHVPPDFIEQLVSKAVTFRIPVFLKRNIWSSLPHTEPFYHKDSFRQEFPRPLLVSSSEKTVEVPDESSTRNTESTKQRHHHRIRKPG